jgi:hypothetical protein
MSEGSGVIAVIGSLDGACVGSFINFIEGCAVSGVPSQR